MIFFINSFCPRFFIFPNKMDSEYEKIMEDIICLEASLINLKRHRQKRKEYYEMEDKKYEDEKAQLKKEIKQKQWQIGAPVTDKEVDDWIEEENEKEHQRLEQLTLEERMKEYYNNKTMLQKAEQRNWNCS